MITQSQIKINLPSTLKTYIEEKARKFGIPVAAYIKHLILKEMEEEYPVYEMSKQTEKKGEKALKEKNKAEKISNIKEFFKNL